LEHGVISLEWHPDDERLLGRYLDRSLGDESLDRHLGNCAGCAARYRSLQRVLESTHEDVTAIADAEFPRARLDAQRRAILLRLGQRDHGRVIAFPERAATPSMPRARLAVAAALIVMTTTGLLRVLGGQPPSAVRGSGAAGSIAAIAPQASARQEAVYLDIEMALVRHGTAELQALDELTPRATGLVPAAR
jgi:hypothetical protein